MNLFQKVISHPRLNRKEGETLNTAQDGGQQPLMVSLFNAFRLKYERKLSRDLITVLKYGEKLIENYETAQIDNGVVCSQFLAKFRAFRERLLTILEQELRSEAIECTSLVRRHLDPIIRQLSQKAQNYEEVKDRSVEIRQLSAQDDETEASTAMLETEIAERVKQLKQYASSISKNLKRDSEVIDSIHSKQSQQTDVVKKSRTGVERIMKSVSVGFFELIAMAVTGLLLWLFGMLVILFL